MPKLDLVLWCWTFLISTSLIPAIVVAYVFFPLKTRKGRAKKVKERMEKAIKEVAENRRKTKPALYKYVVAN